MEPMTDPVDDRESAGGGAKSSRAPDRVTLGKLEADKIDQWLAQINASSKGFLALTRSDAVNFLIRGHKGDLAPKELQQIRADHYDPIRHITWITPQIKGALASGDIARVAELQEELRGVELSVVRGAQGRHNESVVVDKKPQGARPKKPRVAAQSSAEAKLNSASGLASNSVPDGDPDDVKNERFAREKLPAPHDT